MASFENKNVKKDIESDNIADVPADKTASEDISSSGNGEKITAPKTKQKPEPRTRSSAALAREEELIPFAWRYPLELGSQRKVTKVLKELTEAEKLRKSIVPVDER